MLRLQGAAVTEKQQRGWIQQRVLQLKQTIVDDWHGLRFLIYAFALLLLTGLFVIAFYLNHPQVEVSADTPGYLYVTQNILTKGDPFNALRTPGYPLFIALILLVAGSNNLAAVSIVQAVLFVCTVLEIYAITALIVRRAWVAFASGLLVGVNTYLIAYVKPLVVESLCLWLVASLTLAAVLFVRTPRARWLWLVAAFLLAALITRPEWIFAPIPLFAFLLLMVARRARLRRLLLHALVAVVLLYGVLGLLIYQNGQETGYAGLTFVQRINLMGKVMQYHMQNEAPPQYQTMMQQVNTFMEQGGTDPLAMVKEYPAISDHYWEVAGSYATSVIEGHPIEFVLKTLPIMVTSSKGYNTFSPLVPSGPFYVPLVGINFFSADVYRSYQLFPVFALFWVALLFWRRTRTLRSVQMMGVVMFLGLLELTLTSLGGYVEYWRLHIPFDPLVTIVIWGSVFAGISLWGKRLLLRLASSLGWEKRPFVSKSAAPGTALPEEEPQEKPRSSSSALLIQPVSVAPKQASVLTQIRDRLRRVISAMQRILATDWRNQRYAPLGLLLLIITSLATASFYINQPSAPEFSYDTPSYLHVTQQFLASGNPVDPLRTPGYPLLVALIFLLAGVGNFLAVAVVQGILFVIATLEIYVLTALVLRRSWVAFLVGVLVGTNTYLLSFVKPIIVEGFALWLTTSLALAVVLFVKRLKPGYLWLAAGFLLLLFMTRPEWIYLPIPLLAYLLFIARRYGKLRQLLPHGLAATAVLYGVLGLFILVNATQNGYLGVSYVQRINLVGKVLQYHMQNEASPQYAEVQQELDAFAAKGGWNPYDLLTQYSDITANQWSLGGAYASDVIIHHPLEFLADSVFVFFTSSNEYRAFSSFDANGPVATPPFKPEVSLSAYVARTYPFFPLFALFWGGLFFWRRKARAHLPVAEAMGAIVLIVLYELALTTVGGYSVYDYERFHVVFDPLMIVVIWGTLLASFPWWPQAIRRLGLTRRIIWWAWAVLILLAVGGSVIFSWLTLGVSEAFNPATWPIVRLVVLHMPRLLTVLALGALMTFFVHRATRRPQVTSGEVEKPPAVEVPG
jgi:4-amino-4-deoxy-L-arabinose transferase-like glycosyltransferase